MTLMFCILIGAGVGQFAGRWFPLGGAEWRRLTTIGGMVGSLLCYWLSSDASERTVVELDLLAWSALSAAVTVLLMHRLRLRKSE